MATFFSGRPFHADSLQTDGVGDAPQRGRLVVGEVVPKHHPGPQARQDPRTPSNAQEEPKNHDRGR